ncbi:hypothetical protein FVE85_0772 [Porphyridium purpureum]|uniref:Uncharacterized protein n=1 Tax=Porphyridium purpureum TaxID=35688 RepID=A0A5J4Z2A6_PORPP|nr:hypothetical protein FVE85_0772 [Porphyridium purpureum]|eukprot:POR3344..scf208_2
MPLEFRVECVLNWAREDYWKIMSFGGFLDFLVKDGCLKRISATEPEFHDDEQVFRRIRTYVPRHVEAPDMVMRVIGDSMLEVHDHQRWNQATKPFHVDFEIRPTFLREFIETKGYLSLGAYEIPTAEPDAAVVDVAEPGANEEAGPLAPEGTEEDRLQPDTAQEDVPEKEAGGAQTTTSSAGSSPPATMHTVSGVCQVNMFYVGYYLEQAVKQNMVKFYHMYPQHCANFKHYVVEKVKQRRKRASETESKSVRVGQSMDNLSDVMADVAVDDEAEAEKVSAAPEAEAEAEADAVSKEKTDKEVDRKDSPAVSSKDSMLRTTSMRDASSSKLGKVVVTQEKTPDGRTVDVISVPPQEFEEPELPEGESFSMILEEYLIMHTLVSEGVQTEHLFEVSEGTGTEDLA